MIRKAIEEEYLSKNNLIFFIEKKNITITIKQQR